MPDLTLITGAARSGTSLVAKILKAHGAFLGTHNELFEDTAIREGIVKPHLRSMGMDPLGQRYIVPPTPLKPIPDLADRFWRIFKNQGLTDESWVAYKGAKLSFVWPVWHQHFPDAKWIIVRRPDGEIAASCLRTSWMRGRMTHKAWVEWVNEHKGQWTILKQVGDARELWPRKFIDGDYTQLEEVFAWLGKKLRPKVVENCIDRKLFRQSAN